MKCAIYVRLSREDIAQDKAESESIQNQKALLASYANDRDWDIYDIYCDEDYSGADAMRPAFNKLIADAEKKRFSIVLCKTQSRFTRDMELVERYIHGLFPLWGIRFVAVLDHVDTEVKGNKKARQINGLINEWYLEDLSENIKAVLDYKRSNGQYIGSFAAYGYRKDPQNHNHLLIDPEAAKVVQRIFALYLKGYGKEKIAEKLNQENIPNPTGYKQERGMSYKNGGETDGRHLWSRSTVGRILKNELYIGTLVQGKKRKITYKSKRCIEIPSQDWIRVEHTHEPIVDTETFEKVQQRMDRRKNSGLGTVHPLAGLVRCASCASLMRKVTSMAAGKKHSYLRCSLYAKNKALCTGHSIRLDQLEEAVFSRLQAHLDAVGMPQSTWERMPMSQWIREIRIGEADRETGTQRVEIDWNF